MLNKPRLLIGSISASLFVGVLCVGCQDKGQVQVGIQPSDLSAKLLGQSDRFVYIAHINPGDSGRAQRILDNHHIPAAIGGSVDFDIEVSVWDRSKAVELLKQEFAAKGYRIIFHKSN